MAELILGPMLRHVSETSATIWVECDAACTVEVLGHVERTFCVSGHHYALVIVEGLEPGTSTEYDVRLDGRRRWPTDHRLPASRIRTLGHDGPTRILYGSCRTAAPHEPPWTLDLDHDPRGRGMDALYTYAIRMLDHPPEEWPHLAVFLGDQIYADDSSPRTRARIAATRKQEGDVPERRLPPDLVAGFEEFTWLYQESWSPPIERWFLANVPTAMVFDDHDMIDDWNISHQWVEHVHRQAWWEEHVLGGLMTYWLYQHLGNLSPHVIRDEGILERLLHVPDGRHVLEDWARSTDEFSSGPDHYHFNYVRELGPLRLVMIDARNGRDLTPGARRIVDENEWEWIVAACNADDVDHLLIGSSLPVFMPPALHDLEVADEAVNDGRWGKFGVRLGEWFRRRADMEDWPAFGHSFDMFVDLLERIGGASNPNAPRSISVLSGDIHFSYISKIVFPPERPMSSDVHQLVSSPIRNVLVGADRAAMRIGKSHVAHVLARGVRRGVGRRPAAPRWQVDHGPFFENSVGQISLHGDRVDVSVLQARPYDPAEQPQLDVIIDLPLCVGR